MVTAVVAVLGVGIVRALVPPFVDPGCTAPVPVLVGWAIAVVVLAVVALRVLPPRRPRPPVVGTTPAPWTLAVLGTVGACGAMALMWPVFGGPGPLSTRGCGRWCR